VNPYTIQEGAGGLGQVGGPYQRLGIYDAPGLMLSNLLDGRADLPTFKRILFDSDSLSLGERRGLVERFTSGRGNVTSIERTAIGIATNPWVWLWFLTSPVGGSALAAGGKGLFNTVAKKYASQNKKNLGIMSWFKTPAQELDGSGAPATGLWLSNTEKAFAAADMEMVAASKERLIGKIEKMAKVSNLRGEMIPGATEPLSASSYRKGTRIHTIVEGFETTSHAYALGLDVAKNENVKTVASYYAVKDGMGNGKWVSIEEALRRANPQLAQSEGLKAEYMVGIQKLQADREGALRAQWNDLWDLTKNDLVTGQGRADAFAQLRAMAGVTRNKDLKFSAVMERLGIHIQSDVFSGTALRGKKTPQMVDGSTLKQVMDKYGSEGRDYILDMQLARKRSFVRALGNEEEFASTGRFLVDDQKLEGLVYSMRRSNPDGMAPGVTSLQGQEALMSLVGPERFKAMVAGGRDAEEAHRKIKSVLAELVTPDEWDGRWGSRNLYNSVRLRQPDGSLKAAPMGQFEARNIEVAPWSSLNSKDQKLGRISPITEKELLIDPESLEALQKLSPNMLTQAGLDHIEKVRSISNNAFYRNNGKVTLGLRLSGPESHNRYMGNMRQLTTFDIARAPKEVLEADRVAIGLVEDAFGIEQKGTLIGSRMKGVQEAFDDGEYVTGGMLMDRMMLRETSPSRREYIRNVVVPGSLNNAGLEYMATYNSQLQQKEIANWFANGFIGKTIEKFGEPGKKFIQGMRQFGDFSERPTPNNLVGAMAGWLYTTHLGINMASVVLNLTQPLLLAASIGRLDDVLVAYGRAFKEMGNYAKDRMALGKGFATPEQTRNLVKKNFIHSDVDGVDVLGIGPDFHKLFDWQLKNSGTKFDKFVEVMMKGFEKSEWMNRNVTAHMYRRVAERQGGTIRALDMQRFVLETQFGNTPLNTPRVFQQGILGNALLRQFMTFPLRSFVGAWSTFPKLGGGENTIVNVANTALRGMGLSAVVYEFGKGMWGGDLSRGLYAQGATDLLGADRLIQDERSWIPVPPIADIPIGLIRGLAGDDLGLVSDSMARLVPGGVAINRVLGAAPEMPKEGLAGVVGGLQKTYAGWDSPLETGEVPVFNSQGVLIEYKSPGELWARAAGVDTGRYNRQGGLDGFLMKQRDQIIEYRRRYLNALRRNDPAKAMQVAGEYEKRFGIPLSVTQEQVKAFTRSGYVGRTERIADRLPEEVRGAYISYIRDTQGMRNVGEAGLAQPTAVRRDPYRADQERMMREFAEMKRRVDAVGGAAVEQGSVGFGGFDRWD
jgi:hypothetical protein